MKNTSLFLVVGSIWTTTRQTICHVDKSHPTPEPGDIRSLGSNTRVKVVGVTPAHPKFPTKGYYGHGVYVTPTNKHHKHYGKQFYLSHGELESGILATE